MDTFRLFRNVAWMEAISFLLLLLVAMPLKYLADMPLAVKYTGWIHGVLFVLYLLLCGLVAMKYRWNARQFVIACVASIVPLGPFFLRKHLKKEQADSEL